MASGYENVCHPIQSIMINNPNTRKFIALEVHLMNNNFNCSPEKSGVTRLGAKLPPHPNTDKQLNCRLKNQLKPEVSSNWMEAISSHSRKKIRNRANFFQNICQVMYV